jgi:hypothetical protein
LSILILCSAAVSDVTADPSWNTFQTGIDIKKMVIRDAEIWVLSQDGYVYIKNGPESDFEPGYKYGIIINYTLDIVVDSNKNVVLSSRFSGMSRYDGDSWESDNGYLYCEQLYGLIASGNDNKVWFGWSGGLFVFDCYTQAWTPMNASPYSDELRGTDEFIYSLIVGPDNTLWAGTELALMQYKDDVWKRHTTLDIFDLEWERYENGMYEKEDGVLHIATDAEGDVTVASKYKISRLVNETWIAIPVCSTIETYGISALAVDRNGVLWVGTDGGGVCVFDGVSWTVSTAADGLAGNSISQIVIGDDGTIYAVCPTKGISYYIPSTHVSEEMSLEPEEITIDNCYPNPFNPFTTIHFSLAASGYVTVDIYNIAGQKVETLASGYKSPGTHALTFDGARHASGAYFYRFNSKSFSKTGKIMLVK